MRVCDFQVANRRHSKTSPMKWYCLRTAIQVYSVRQFWYQLFVHLSVISTSHVVERLINICGKWRKQMQMSSRSREHWYYNWLSSSIYASNHYTHDPPNIHPINHSFTHTCVSLKFQYQRSSASILRGNEYWCNYMKTDIVEIYTMLMGQGHADYLMAGWPDYSYIDWTLVYSIYIMIHLY